MLYYIITSLHTQSQPKFINTNNEFIQNTILFNKFWLVYYVLCIYTFICFLYYNLFLKKKFPPPLF